jgi:hypothetical protein
MITGGEREERIEHYVAVVARDIGGRPDRVEDAQIVAHDKMEGLAVAGPYRPTQPGGEGSSAVGQRKLATHHPVRHSRPYRLRVTENACAKIRPMKARLRGSRISISCYRRIVIADRPYESRDAARLLFIAASRQIRNLPMLLQTGQSDRFPGMSRRALRGSSDRVCTKPRFGGGTWCASARGDADCTSEGLVAEVAEKHPER